MTPGEKVGATQGQSILCTSACVFLPVMTVLVAAKNCAAHLCMRGVQGGSLERLLGAVVVLPEMGSGICGP